MIATGSVLHDCWQCQSNSRCAAPLALRSPRNLALRRGHSPFHHQLRPPHGLPSLLPARDTAHPKTQKLQPSGTLSQLRWSFKRPSIDDRPSGSFDTAFTRSLPLLHLGPNRGVNNGEKAVKCSNFFTARPDPGLAQDGLRLSCSTYRAARDTSDPSSVTQNRTLARLTAAPQSQTAYCDVCATRRGHCLDKGSVGNCGVEKDPLPHGGCFLLRNS